MNLMRLAAALLGSVLIAACAESVSRCEDGGSSCIDSGPDESTGDADPCNSNLCPGPNNVCIAGQCVARCGPPRGCLGGQDPNTCECLCTDNSQCEPGTSCNNGTCEPLNCADELCEECPLGQRQDPNSCCACIPGCVDSQCDEGFACGQEGECVALLCPDILCEPCGKGTTLDPNACCSCIPQVCTSNESCEEGLQCSTARGVCNSPPDCLPNMDCEDLCYGTCEPIACEGTRPTQPQKSCRSRSDCTENFEDCLDEDSGCGICMRDQCLESSDCPTGLVCTPTREACTCDGTGFFKQCEPDCRTADGACRDGLECNASTGQCLEPRCTEPGNTCPANKFCDPSITLGDGCKKTACQNDLECGCGFCVNGSCQSNLGSCSPPRP